MTDRIDIVGIGNALVDVLVEVDDATIVKHRLPRGDMLLTDAKRFASVLSDVTPKCHSYGGNACNTVAGLVSLGLTGRFVGKIATDALGAMFRQEMAEAGVRFETAPLAAGRLATASCLILVTPDGQRTGITHLGACGELGTDDVPSSLLAESQMVFMEAYLLDRTASAELVWSTAGMVRAAGCSLAFTLSDPNCVTRHRDELVHFLRARRVEILFANRAEVLALAATTELDVALELLREVVPVTAVTLGPQGALVVSGPDSYAIPSVATSIVDTTGAGDLFAAGFLAAWKEGRSLPASGEAGTRAAAAILSRLGSKPPEGFRATVLRPE
jgi:sugar/nucleoside kinase (ribokinase family)